MVRKKRHKAAFFMNVLFLPVREAVMNRPFPEKWQRIFLLTL